MERERKRVGREREKERETEREREREVRMAKRIYLIYPPSQTLIYLNTF
jgi:hypothetical protein